MIILYLNISDATPLIKQCPQPVGLEGAKTTAAVGAVQILRQHEVRGGG